MSYLCLKGGAGDEEVHDVAVPVLHGSKVGSKAQFTQDVDSQQRRPDTHIPFLAPTGRALLVLLLWWYFLGFGDVVAPISYPFEDIFLQVLQGALGECVVEESPPGRVELAVRNGMCGIPDVDPQTGIRPARFDHIGSSVRVDVVQGSGGSKGELVGSEPDDVSCRVGQ